MVFHPRMSMKKNCKEAHRIGKEFWDASEYRDGTLNSILLRMFLFLHPVISCQLVLFKEIVYDEYCINTVSQPAMKKAFRNLLLRQNGGTQYSILRLEGGLCQL